jgi:hypothetical protein
MLPSNIRSFFNPLLLTNSIRPNQLSRESFMKTTRRSFVVAAAAAPPLERAAQAAAAKKADFLFVQTAKSMTFDKGANKLVLEGVSPITIMFADRPERIASQMKTERFVPFWSEGKNSFLSDPPNADISIIERGKLHQIVVTLMDPSHEGDRLSYKVKVLEGEMPDEGSDISLFIDIIGMPLTPLSFAGARRRAWRRAVWY